jgi:hypothetical protein
MDVAMRGTVTPVPVLEQVLGPLFVSVPASSRTDTACSSAQRSVRWLVNDLFNTRELEVACLDASELDANMTVMVTDTTTHAHHCARTGEGGTFRVAVPASVGDGFAVQVVNAPDAVDDYKDCNLTPGAPLGRLIDPWEQPAKSYAPVATPGVTCTADAGCQQYRDVFYPVGSPLVAPQEGLGLKRQTPDFRNEVTLSQAALDPADPINFAPLYMLRAAAGVDGAPQPARPLLVVTTAGDDEVTTAAGLAFARAAGALPFLPPSAVYDMPEYADYATPQALFMALGGKTPNQVLIENGEMEGVSREARTPVTSCGNNYVTSATCNAPPPANDPGTCAHTLYDADWLGESLQTYGQLHAAVPLRLARQATLRVTDAGSLEQTWSPRIQGVPFAADGAYAPGAPLVASVTAYMKPTGQHDWSVGEPCQSFDATTYMDNLLGRFFASSGTDLYYLSHPASHACLRNTSCDFQR